MISTIILTKNSEHTIADCLETIRPLGGEILVIDSESTDRTTDIAKHLGARVIVNPMTNFAAQRNVGMKNAKGSWVLYIDSDEHVTKKFINEVLTIIKNHQNDSGVGGYFIKRKTFYLGRDWGYTDRLQRLFLKDAFKEWYGVVHETPKVTGKFGQVESPILHFTHSNLTQMVDKTNEWSEFESDLRIKSNHPKMTSWRFFRVMITGFLGSYIKNKGYKNGTEGIIEAIFQSYSMFITYAKLWEKQTNVS